MVPWQQGELLPNWIAKITLEEGLKEIAIKEAKYLYKRVI